jgi:arylsulfatase
VSVWKPIEIDEYKWELYHVTDDFSESVNLADKEPANPRALQDLFWVEAAKYDTLPIGERVDT